MDARLRFRWSLALALGAHAAIFAWPVLAARAGAGATGSPGESQVVTEMDVDVEPPPPTDSTPDTEEPALPARSLDQARARAQARSGAARSPEGAPSSGIVEAPAGAPETDGSWTFSPTGDAPAGARLSTLALNAAVGAGIRATLDEDRKARKPIDPLQQSLRAYTPHDMELGLVPGGELVSMTRDTVRTSNAPSVGHARIQFQIDAAGAVASVQVLDATSDRADWDAVAATLAKEAREHMVRVPSGSRGLALTLDIDSAMKNLSGLAPTSNGLTKVWRAVNDPLDAVLDGTSAPVRVVAARIVDVQLL